MARILPVRFELSYQIEFPTVICRYHIYKDIWVPSIGQNLVCKTDTREEATEYDKNVVVVLKSGEKETLFESLPIEISCLLTYFLKAARSWKRKREVGLIVPVNYVAPTKNKTFGNILL